MCCGALSIRPRTRAMTVLSRGPGGAGQSISQNRTTNMKPDFFRYLRDVLVYIAGDRLEPMSEKQLTHEKQMTKYIKTSCPTQLITVEDQSHSRSHAAT